MRFFIVIASLISLSAFGEYIEHYVTFDGTDTWANATDIGTPCSLATAFANCTAGERANIKSDGTYSIGTTSAVNGGTGAQLSVYRGYDSAIGDLEGIGHNTNGSLDITNYPDITLTGTLTPKLLSELQNLKITGNNSVILLGSTSADNVSLISCYVENTGTGLTVRGDNYWKIIDCDLVRSGASSSTFVQFDLGTIVCRSRFSSANTESIGLKIHWGTVVKCEFYECTLSIVTVTGPTLIDSCTFYGASEGIRTTNQVSLIPVVIIDCVITDNIIGIYNPYVATENSAVIELNNRMRDNTNDRTGIGDGVNIGEITIDTGGPETDYVNAGAGNLRLISGAPGETAGLIEYSDVGAYQIVPGAGGGGTAQLVNGGLVK